MEQPVEHRPDPQWARTTGAGVAFWQSMVNAVVVALIFTALIGVIVAAMAVYLAVIVGVLHVVGAWT